MLQTRQITFSFQRIPIDKFIYALSEKFSLDMASTNVHFEVEHTFGKVTANQTDSSGNLSVKNISDLNLSNLELSIDAEKLDRVFANLFSNAIKYSNEQPRIRIDYELIVDDRELLIKVTDSGIGISPEDLPYIFDRSYKASGAQQMDGYKSDGLGLAIVKEIISYHGGRIWAESELCKGSCFFFTLPICDVNKIM